MKKIKNKNKKFPELANIQTKPIDIKEVVKLAKKAEKSWREQQKYLRNLRLQDEYQVWG